MSTPTPSAEFQVNAADVTGIVSVDASSTVALAVKSEFGIESIQWSVKGSSSSALTNPTISTSGTPLGITAEFTMPSGRFKAFVIECKVNQQVDELGREVSAYVFRAVISIPDEGGNHPFVFGESLERSATHGIVEDLNALVSAARKRPRVLLSASRDSEIGDEGSILVYDGDDSTIVYTVDDAHFRYGQTEIHCTRNGTVRIEATNNAELHGPAFQIAGKGARCLLSSHGAPGDTPSPMAVEPARGTAQASAEIDNLSTATDEDFDFPITVEDVYQARVVVMLRLTGGGYRTWTGKVDFSFASATLALLGSAAAESSGDSTGVAVTVSASSPNLRVNVNNTTGVTANGWVKVFWERDEP